MFSFSFSHLFVCVFIVFVLLFTIYPSSSTSSLLLPLLLLPLLLPPLLLLPLLLLPLPPLLLFSTPAGAGVARESEGLEVVPVEVSLEQHRNLRGVWREGGERERGREEGGGE